MRLAGAAGPIEGDFRENARSSDYDDEFDGNSLDPKWSWLNAAQEFNVGANVSGWLHVVSANNTNFGPSDTSGTFLYQNLSGNLTLETKLNATPAAGVEKTGLLLYNSATNWMALKYQVDGGGPYVEVGVQTPSSFGNLYWTAVTANPIWLRLVKDGLTLTTFYSSDGENWTEQFNYTQPFDDPFMAGLLVSDGYSGTNFSVDFDYFRFSYPNRVPEALAPLLPVTFNEDQKYAISVFDHFKDPDGDNLTFKAKAPHIKGSFNLALHDFEIYGNANWFGSENVTITATDPAGRFAQATLNVTVLPVEDPPILNQELPDVMVLQNGTNGTLNLTRFFLDNDTAFGVDDLTYSMYGNGPIRVNLTPAGKVTFSAPISFWGVQDMTFSATDRAQNMASGPCKVTVVHVNQAPQVVRPTVPDITMMEDEMVTMDFGPVFWDPDGEPITLVPAGEPRIEIITAPDTLNLTFRPRPDDSGFTESIALIAQDYWKLGTNWVQVNVTVTAVNDPPRITKYTPPGELVIKENQSQAYNITASDAENGKKLNCTWYLDGVLADWAQFEYVYRPGFTSAGKHTIMVTVSDGELSVKRSWEVTVENVNRDPYNVRILSPRPGASFEPGENVTLEGSAQDLDGETLQYTWFSGSRELGEGPKITRTFAAGTHNLYLRVTDGIADSESNMQLFTVKGNAAPKLFSLDPGNGQKFARGANIHFKADAGDTDGDMLAFCWTENGRQLSSSAEFYRSDLSEGSHNIRLTISDGKATIDTSLTIEITPPASGGPGLGLYAMIGGAVVVAAVAAAVAVFLLRRKRRAAR